MARQRNRRKKKKESVNWRNVATFTVLRNSPVSLDGVDVEFLIRRDNPQRCVFKLKVLWANLVEQERPKHANKERLRRQRTGRKKFRLEINLLRRERIVTSMRKDKPSWVWYEKLVSQDMKDALWGAILAHPEVEKAFATGRQEIAEDFLRKYVDRMFHRARFIENDLHPLRARTFSKRKDALVYVRSVIMGAHEVFALSDTEKEQTLPLYRWNAPEPVYLRDLLADRPDLLERHDRAKAALMKLLDEYRMPDAAYRDFHQLKQGEFGLN